MILIDINNINYKYKNNFLNNFIINIILKRCRNYFFSNILLNYTNLFSKNINIIK